jgi:hypothetical protein
MSEPTTEAPAPEAPAPSVNWQTAFRLKADLRQKDIYAFETELRLLEKSAPAVNTVVAQSLTGHADHRHDGGRQHRKRAPPEGGDQGRPD